MPKSIEDGVAMAAKCWADGFNCAESVLRGVCHAEGIETPEVALKMATPFGGGVGRSEDLCGALAGGVLGIGAVKGRVLAQDDRLRSYDAAGKFHGMFLEKFGSTSCKILNRSDFKSPAHRTRCEEFTTEATRLALRVLREK